jgi:hypothetical protein
MPFTSPPSCGSAAARALSASNQVEGVRSRSARTLLIEPSGREPSASRLRRSATAITSSRATPAAARSDPRTRRPAMPAATTVAMSRNSAGQAGDRVRVSPRMPNSPHASSGGTPHTSSRPSHSRSGSHSRGHQATASSGPMSRIDAMRAPAAVDTGASPPGRIDGPSQYQNTAAATAASAAGRCATRTMRSTA